MGLQGPLTAQALGRSPYEETPEGPEHRETIAGDESGENPEAQQQYDHRGRPINPESKRINRDIIRAHNEVMLVVGVAEPDNPILTTEGADKARHHYYEEAIGSRLFWASKRCVEAVGVFGLTGFRQRVLTYRYWSTTPLWDTYQSTWNNLDTVRDVFAGVPSTLLSQYIDRRFFGWEYLLFPTFRRRCAHKVWSYTKAHLELFAAFQRLGLLPAHQLLPSWRFFIPFTSDSPIRAPPAPMDFSTQSITQWLGAAALSAAPFLMWWGTQWLIEDWRLRFWQLCMVRLPTPASRGRFIGTFPEIPPSEVKVDESLDQPEDPMDSEEQGERAAGEVEQIEEREEALVASSENETAGDDSPLQQAPEEGDAERDQSAEQGEGVGGGEDYDSEEDAQEGVSATLISFDVEATEATDVPATGLWSAELRPSVSPDTIPSMPPSTVYLVTMLTRLPQAVAARILSDQVVRLLITPIETLSLRAAALSALGLSVRGSPLSDIMGVRAPYGLTVIWYANLLKVEFMHLAICGEIFAAATGLATYFHRSEEQWKESGGNDWGTWFSPFSEPLY